MADGGLSARRVETSQHPGTTSRPIKLADANGLFLQITTTQSKSWLLRYTLAGKTREMGLGKVGKAPDGVSLANARLVAAEAKALARRGIDPIDHRITMKRDEIAARRKAENHTFRSVAEEMLASREVEWRNLKHRQQWRNTLVTYAFPILGSLPVSKITTDDVLAVLQPIWTRIPETAGRVRGRIERVLSSAKAKGLREGDNPAAWRGHLDEALPSPRKIQGREPGHHPALPWDQVAAFMLELRTREAVSARALEFLILTASRTSEVLQATWQEIDLDTGIWTVPAARMKAKREHRVALSEPAKLLLGNLKPLSPGNESPVFPGTKADTYLSSMALLMLLRRMNTPEEGQPAKWRDRSSGEPITAHGFRSTFRDWAGEESNHPTAIAEAALAHTMRDKTESAYARGDSLEKRRALMTDWGAYCSSQQSSAGKLPAGK
jgi:integrase